MLKTFFAAIVLLLAVPLIAQQVRPEVPINGTVLSTEFGASSTQNYMLTIDKLEIDEALAAK